MVRQPKSVTFPVVRVIVFRCLTITPTDYAKALILMMDGGTRSAWEISEESRPEMLSIRTIYRANILGFGHGWVVERKRGGGIVSTGPSAWAHSACLCDPDTVEEFMVSSF
jgi:hypothetical protein